MTEFRKSVRLLLDKNNALPASKQKKKQRFLKVLSNTHLSHKNKGAKNGSNFKAALKNVALRTVGIDSEKKQSSRGARLGH